MTIDPTKLDWQKGHGLLPAIIQDAETDKILMLGYMNEAAFRATVDTGFVTFFSRSRQCLWQKGETSGNRLSLSSLSADCDNDTLLVKAKPSGPICHLGDDTCFKEENKKRGGLGFLSTLETLIASRQNDNADDSYTARLFKMGLEEIAKKVGEEGVEVALAGNNQNGDKLIEESADLIYHLMVLLRANNKNIVEVADCLANRHKKAIPLVLPMSKTSDTSSD